MKENKTIYAILGLLSHTPMTGYDIKKRIDSTLKYFWSASFGSIYPSLNEMEQRNLVKKEALPNEKGREKFVYEITNEGRDYLRSWLLEPDVRDELRYETLLKLFFGNEAGKETSLDRIEAFRQKYEAELPKLTGAVKALSGILEEDETHKYYMLTAMFGVKVFEAYVEWAKEAAAILGTQHDAEN